MIDDDTFLEIQRRIINSKIREVFVPSKPVSQNFFCGRSEEVQKIVGNLGIPGMHILLYGDRGVGKTSLANYASNSAVKYNLKEKIISICCVKSDTFESISHQIFQELNIRNVTRHVESVDLNGNAKILSGGRKKEEESVVYSDFNSPSWVARQIMDYNCVIVIDEFDVITKKGEKQKFSQLIKILSDSGSKVSFLLVGIALSANELIEGHSSITRCIAEVKLNRMSNTEIEDILNKGEIRINISFEKQVKDLIVSVSSGFPYFAHLLALKAGEIAIAEDRKKITIDVYERGMAKAIDAIEETLKEQYTKVVGEIEKKKDLMYCAALLGNGDFTSKQLQNKYKEIKGVPIEQLEINNSIAKAMSDGTETILRRKRKGVYFFNDPRMPVYIKLLKDS